MNSPPSSSSSANVDLLDERVRRFIWEKKWTALRDVQERAIPVVLAADRDIILAASTASGKTEAAFFPIVSRIVSEDSERGLRALYVSPLKALINDQWARLDELCERLEIPVHRWHGDVSADRKRKVLKRPDGILLITPESLEALFVTQGPRIQALFGALQYAVIDELHAFIGSERGRQLQSLLHRVELARRGRVPRIGLSATIGDFGLAQEYLRPGGAAAVLVIAANKDSATELRVQVRGYREQSPPKGDNGDAVPAADRSVAQHLFRSLRGRHNLIFANARKSVEHYADLLRRLSGEAHVPNEFEPHHGSLSKELREDVERRLKDRARPTTAVCTSTLEMGIDIGDVASVAQIGAPSSVASLRQRLGRSGRRGEPAVLRGYVIERELRPNVAPQDAIRTSLTQMVAMVELVLEGWCEPPAEAAFHYSTLVQQLLSVIAQFGSVSAADAHNALCATGAFRNVTSKSFSLFLRGLASKELIAQMGDGELVLAGKGERLVNHYEFYAAFQSPEEFRVVCGAKTLGQLQVDGFLLAASHLVFAGRRWKVVAVLDKEKIVDVVPSAGGAPPRFGGSCGAVHERVRRRMREIYGRHDLPAFLDAEAAELLAEGRGEFTRLALGDRQLVIHGRDVLLFPWTGDREMETLVAMLLDFELDVERDGVAVALHDIGESDALSVLRSLARQEAPDGPRLAQLVHNKVREKYDHFLPDELLEDDFAARYLNTAGALAVVRGLVES